MDRTAVLRKIKHAADNYLDLSKMGLTEIPEEILQLVNISRLHLYLSDNQISVIPDSITQLANLLSLVLSGNQISVIPNSIAQLTNLSGFDLSHNHSFFTVLPILKGKDPDSTKDTPDKQLPEDPHKKDLS